MEATPAQGFGLVLGPVGQKRSLALGHALVLCAASGPRLGLKSTSPGGICESSVVTVAILAQGTPQGRSAERWPF